MVEKTKENQKRNIPSYPWEFLLVEFRFCEQCGVYICDENIDAKWNIFLDTFYGAECLIIWLRERKVSISKNFSSAVRRPSD